MYFKNSSFVYSYSLPIVRTESTHAETPNLLSSSSERAHFGNTVHQLSVANGHVVPVHCITRTTCKSFETLRRDLVASLHSHIPKIFHNESPLYSALDASFVTALPQPFDMLRSSSPLSIMHISAQDSFSLTCLARTSVIPFDEQGC
jgi:hypothetical protein